MQLFLGRDVGGKKFGEKFCGFFLDVNSTWILRVIGTLMLSYVWIPWSSVWHEWRPTDSGQWPFTIIVLGDYPTTVDVSWMAPFRFLLLRWTDAPTSMVENNPSLDVLSLGNRFLAAIFSIVARLKKIWQMFGKNIPINLLIGVFKYLNTLAKILL